MIWTLKNDFLDHSASFIQDFDDEIFRSAAGFEEFGASIEVTLVFRKLIKDKLAFIFSRAFLLQKSCITTMAR